MAAKGTTAAEKAEAERLEAEAEAKNDKAKKPVDPAIVEADKQAEEEAKEGGASAAAIAAGRKAIAEAEAKAETEGTALTMEDRAKIRAEAIGEVDPGLKPPTVQPPTPGASATNPALMDNKADPKKVHPFGHGNPGQG